MVATTAVPVFAELTLDNGNTWRGDEVQHSFETGEYPYVYAIAQDKANNVLYYETSSHAVQLTGGGAVHIFPMVDTTKVTGQWIPDGIYNSGVSNYDVMYCCDATTSTADGISYKRVNLEDSEYVSDADAKRLRAIVSNAYPYVSVEEAKAALTEAGFAQAEELDRSELIAATQAAIWTIANPDSGDSYRYNKTATTAQKLTWGGYMHEFASEITNFTDSTTSRQYLSNPNGVGDRIDALIDFYLAMEGSNADAGQIVITKLDVLNSKPADKRSAGMDLVLNVRLNHSGDADDTVAIDVYVGEEVVETVGVVAGQELYSIPVTAAEGAEIKVVVSGTQNLEKGVYFYQPKPQDIDGDGIATSREVSQNLIGVANGETPVYAEAFAKVENGDLVADKKAEEIEDGKYEVSITVPGGDAEEKHDEVILMVDGSYSMDNEWPAMKEAINAIGAAVLNNNGNTQLTLMAFGMGDNIVLEHVKSVADLAAALGELPGNLLYGRSSTNCEAGFTGVAEYIENHDDTLGKVDVIFISDGNLNTDETPRAFDANWQTWTKFGALFVAQAAFEETLAYGENLPAAFTTVFGNRFDGMTNEEILNAVFAEEPTITVTDAEFIAFAEQLWTDVYAYSGLTRGAKHPVSDVERAFVKYDKENGTYIQDLFYYTTYKSAYVTYGDRWTRTPAAANALADMDEVNHLYIVDYDAETAWMKLGHEKSTFVLSSGIAGLVEALGSTITTLATTPYNNVTVTDYMSKWVNIDFNTLKIVDNVTGATLWTYNDGWADGVTPLTAESPIDVKLVTGEELAAGGPDVAGNMNGDIYLLTWRVKDGALLRSDNYSMVYEVTVDTAEDGYKAGTLYPANGYTDLTYTDPNGTNYTNEIEVPDVETEKKDHGGCDKPNDKPNHGGCDKPNDKPNHGGCDKPNGKPNHGGCDKPNNKPNHRGCDKPNRTEDRRGGKECSNKHKQRSSRNH
jgi:TQXA domain-containing protein